MYVCMYVCMCVCVYVCVIIMMCNLCCWVLKRGRIGEFTDLIIVCMYVCVCVCVCMCDNNDVQLVLLGLEKGEDWGVH